ncbi:amidohydrolase [Halobacillus sp. Marseille-Q1614]|uniref:amidohydrolase n=1 Tax=Halobacillus sp. Marseille-Q1614 TaxID=2709134 RepID=UPI001570DED9|nr:amidohydrolase [Halobacillus sp. Marseille-Q1614]
MNGADLIFLNGHVLTMDDDLPSASAVAVNNGRIVYVGDRDNVFNWKGENTEIVDLQGKTLMPGFIESHIHPAVYAASLLEVDCKPEAAPSIQDLLDKVKEKAAVTPENHWIVGWGFDDSKLEERRNPTRFDLDEAAPDHPVVLKRTCAHMAVANSKAFELSGITEATANPQGGHLERDQAGSLTGLLQEKAQGLLKTPPYSREDMVKGMKLAQTKLASWGITTVHDMSTQTEDLQLYQYLLEQDELSVRVRPWMWAIDQNGFNGSMEEVLKVGVRSGFGNDQLKIQGLKFMLDGSIGGKTAAVSDPYLGTEETGILYNTVEEMAPLMKRGIESGMRIAIHAIGDRAIDVAIHSFLETSKTENIADMRNRIEHCIFPSKTHMEKMKELGLMAASSIGFMYHIGDNYVKKLGEERMKQSFPHKSFKEFGIPAPGNSDLPITDGNPWFGIYSAVTRKTHSGQLIDEEESISVWEALKAYTTYAAYSSFEENILGVIKPQAYADLMVVSDHPMEMKEEELLRIQTERTYVAGKLIYSKS